MILGRTRSDHPTKSVGSGAPGTSEATAAPFLTITPIGLHFDAPPV